MLRVTFLWIALLSLANFYSLLLSLWIHNLWGFLMNSLHQLFGHCVFSEPMVHLTTFKRRTLTEDTLWSNCKFGLKKFWTSLKDLSLKLLTLLSGCLSKISTGMSNETECLAYTSPISPENCYPLSCSSLPMASPWVQQLYNSSGGEMPFLSFPLMSRVQPFTLWALLLPRYAPSSLTWITAVPPSPTGFLFPSRTLETLFKRKPRMLLLLKTRQWRNEGTRKSPIEHDFHEHCTSDLLVNANIRGHSFKEK